MLGMEYLSRAINTAHYFLAVAHEEVIPRLAALPVQMLLSFLDETFPDMMTTMELEAVKSRKLSPAGVQGWHGYLYSWLFRDQIARYPSCLATLLEARAKITPRQFRPLDNASLQLGWELLRFKLVDCTRPVNLNAYPDPRFVDYRQDILHNDGIYLAPRALILLNCQTRIYEGLAAFAQEVINATLHVFHPLDVSTARETSPSTSSGRTPFADAREPDEGTSRRHLQDDPLAHAARMMFGGEQIDRGRVPVIDAQLENTSKVSSLPNPTPLSQAQAKNFQHRNTLGTLVEPVATPRRQPFRRSMPVASTRNESTESVFSSVHFQQTQPPKRSQFGDAEYQPRKEPRQKTRPSFQPFVEDDEEADSEVQLQSDEECRDRLVFQDRDLYNLWCEVFPLSGHGNRLGRELSFADLRRVMTAPPLSFSEVSIEMPEVKFRRPKIGSTEARSFTLHLPHGRAPVFNKQILDSLKVRLRQNIGWQAEDFALQE